MRALIAINRSDLIDNVAVEFCKFYKLLDVNVCLGAVNEYKVRFYCTLVVKKENFFGKSECGYRGLGNNIVDYERTLFTGI